MAMVIPPVPRHGQVLEKLVEKIHYHWDNWFQQIAAILGLAGQQVGSVALTAQHATVSAGTFTTAPLSQGLYRMSYYARITRAATVSSSLTVEVDWTDGGQSCAQTFAAITANTITTTQGAVTAFQIDAGTTPTYTLSYATNGATSMQYLFTASLEALP